jgi:hypothetical protein
MGRTARSVRLPELGGPVPARNTNAGLSSLTAASLLAASLEAAAVEACLCNSLILRAVAPAPQSATSKSGAHSHWVRSQVERRKGVDIAEALAVDGETAASSARYRPSFRGWP